MRILPNPTVTVDSELPATAAVPSNNSEAISGLTLPFLRALLTVKDTNGLINTSTLSGTAPSSDGITVANLLALHTASLGHTFNETTADRLRGNTSATLLASAARTTTQTSDDITNYNARGIQVTLDMTNVAASPSVTVTINGKDPASGKYYLLLSGAAITTVSTNTYTIYPGATVAANVSASNVLPRTFQIVVTANNANSGVLLMAGKHPGFTKVSSEIAQKEGVSPAAARAILAKSTRGASSAAKRANPRLRRVK